MTEVARFVVGHHLLRSTRRHRSLDTRECQPFVNILHLRIPKLGPLHVAGVIGQESRIVLEMRPAASGVANNRIEGFGRELVDIPPGQFLRQLPLAIVRVKRSAAMLVGRSDHLATIAGKDFGRVAIDVTEDQVLSAAGEQRDSVTTNPLSTSHRRNQVLGPLGLHRWSHGFQFPQTPRQQPSQAQSPYRRLKPQALPKLHHSAQELQPVQVHEEPPKTQGPDQRPTRCGQHPRGLRLSPRPLEEFRVVYPRRTGRHASQTSETIIHLVGKGLGGL